MIDIECFVCMLLKSMRNVALPITDVERLHNNKLLFAIEILMHNDFDIDWLKEKLEHDDYLKLEDYILYYCSRNDELIFRLGFKYAWSLFHECIEKDKMESDGNTRK